MTNDIISQKRLKIDLAGYIQRGVLQALNPLYNRVTVTAIVPGEANCAKIMKNVLNGELLNLRLELLGNGCRYMGMSTSYMFDKH